MYIAMNRFAILHGKEEAFENVWRNRNSYLHEVPGFLAFHLLRGTAKGKTTVFLSHSQWESEAAFIAWTKSEAFTLAHKSAAMPEGILLGPPRFEGYRSVNLSARQES